MVGSLMDARPPRQQVRRHSAPPSLAGVLGGLAVACAAFVVLGSIEFRTTRVWDHGGGTGSSWTEGAARWAGWTFLSGLIAVALLLLAAWLVAEEHRRWGGVLAMTAAAPLLFAAERANSNWQRLLQEQDRPRDYVLTIAPGLPIVTISAGAGAFFALLLAVAWARG